MRPYNSSRLGPMPSSGMDGECPVPSHWEERLPLWEAGTMGCERVSRGSGLPGNGSGFSPDPNPFQVSPRSIDNCARSWSGGFYFEGNFYSTSPLGFFDGIVVQPSLGLEVSGSPSSGIRAKTAWPLWDLKDGRWGSTRPGRVHDAPPTQPNHWQYPWLVSLS